MIRSLRTSITSYISPLLMEHLKLVHRRDFPSTCTWALWLQDYSPQTDPEDMVEHGGMRGELDMEMLKHASTWMVLGINAKLWGPWC